MTSGMTANKNDARARPAAHRAGLDAAIARAVDSLLSLQHADGHWVFELEADATIPAEYVLLQHYPRHASTRRWKREIARLSARASRARTAAGRCSTAARSTSAPA